MMSKFATSLDFSVEVNGPKKLDTMIGDVTDNFTMAAPVVNQMVLRSWTTFENVVVNQNISGFFAIFQSNIWKICKA